MLSSKDLIKVFAICNKIHSTYHTSITLDQGHVNIEIGDFSILMTNKDWLLRHHSHVGSGHKDYRVIMYGSRTYQKANCFFNASPFLKVTSVSFLDVNEKKMEMDIPPDIQMNIYSTEELIRSLDAVEMFDFFLSVHADNLQDVVLKAFLEFNFRHFSCIQAHIYPSDVFNTVDFSSILEQEDLLYEA